MAGITFRDVTGGLPIQNERDRHERELQQELGDDKHVTVVEVQDKLPMTMLSLKNEDIQPLLGARECLLRLAGQIAAHKDCADHEKCPVYDEDTLQVLIMMSDKLRFLAQTASELAPVLRDIERLGVHEGAARHMAEFSHFRERMGRPTTTSEPIEVKVTNSDGEEQAPFFVKNLTFQA